jgi:regulator of sigma E protease
MVVLLGLCVFVHELGHLLGGKLVGIKARVFSIGFGKGIIKKEFNGTTYQIAPFPLGGYCSFYGEDAAETREGKSYEFLTAAPWKRIVTVAAGPFFNLVFGIILFFVMNLVGYSTETNRILIPEQATKGDFVSPAYQAGLRSGDRIVEIQGKKIMGFGDIQSASIFSNGQPLAMIVERDGSKQNFTVTPRKREKKGYYLVGILPYGGKILIADVEKGGMAEAAGLKAMDQIVSLDGVQVKNEEQVIAYIDAHLKKPVEIVLDRRGVQITATLTPSEKDMVTLVTHDEANEWSLSTENTALIKEGIKKGQVKLNGVAVSSFEDFTAVIGKNKGKSISLENAGGSYSGVVTYKKFGDIGFAPGTSPELVHVSYSFGGALVNAFAKPYEFIVMNLKGIGMLITGEIKLRENLSGPIRIAKIAGDTAYYRGISEFIVLMAKISIVLMIMNLLPLPAVDGSFIIFFTVEWLRGRALNEKIMERIQMVGFAFIVLLSIFVIFNDLTFLPVFQKFMAIFR